VSLRHRLLSLALLLAVCGSSGDAVADDALQAAEESFRQGQQAVERGEYLAAARAFARADELAPKPLALQAALDVALMADDAALGMELVERAEKLKRTASWSPEIAESTEKARAKFSDRVGKLRIDCSACTVVVDGLPHPAREPRWLGIGKHRVELAQAGRSAELQAEVLAGRETVMTMAAAPRIETPAVVDPPRANGISPAFFFVGLGLTLTSGAGLIASAVDTRSKHDEFERAPSPSSEQKDDGEAAQLRTNVLIGVTGGLGAATVIVAILSDWAALAPERPRVSIARGPGEVGLAIEARF